MFDFLRRKSKQSSSIPPISPELLKDKIDYSKASGKTVKNYNDYDSTVILSDNQQKIVDDKRYNMRQREQLEIGFKQGLNAYLYANPNIDEECMGAIRYWLLDDLEDELKKYNYMQLDYRTLNEIRNWYSQKLERELKKFDYESLSASMLAEIREWFNNGLGAKLKTVDLNKISVSEMRGIRNLLIEEKQKRRENTTSKMDMF